MYLPDPLSRERGFARYMGQSLNTHRGKHRSGGAQKFSGFWGAGALQQAGAIAIQGK